MKASLLITLILFKSLLIDPTIAASLSTRNEWDCIDNVLFNEQVMKILLSLPEEDCQNGLPDPETLFKHINLLESGNNGRDDFETQLLDTPLTLENLGINNRKLGKIQISSDLFVDQKHNSALETFELDPDFDVVPQTAESIHTTLNTNINIDVGLNEKTNIRTEKVEEEINENNEYDFEGSSLNFSEMDRQLREELEAQQAKFKIPEVAEREKHELIIRRVDYEAQIIKKETPAPSIKQDDGLSDDQPDVKLNLKINLNDKQLEEQEDLNEEDRDEELPLFNDRLTDENLQKSSEIVDLDDNSSNEDLPFQGISDSEIIRENEKPSKPFSPKIFPDTQIETHTANKNIQTPHIDLTVEQQHKKEIKTSEEEEVFNDFDSSELHFSEPEFSVKMGEIPKIRENLGVVNDIKIIKNNIVAEILSRPQINKSEAKEDQIANQEMLQETPENSSTMTETLTQNLRTSKDQPEIDLTINKNTKEAINQSEEIITDNNLDDSLHFSEPEFIHVAEIPKIRDIKFDNDIKITKKNYIAEIIEQPKTEIAFDFHDSIKSSQALSDNLGSVHVPEEYIVNEEFIPVNIDYSESSISSSNNDNVIPENLNQSIPNEQEINTSLSKNELPVVKNSEEANQLPITIDLNAQHTTDIQTSQHEEEEIDQNNLEDSLRFSEPEFIHVASIPAIKELNKDHSIEIRKVEYIAEVQPNIKPTITPSQSNDIEKIDGSELINSSDDILPERINSSEIKEESPKNVEQEEKINVSTPSEILESEKDEEPTNNLDKSSIQSSEQSVNDKTQEIDISITKSQKDNVQESVNEEEVVDNTLEDSIKFSEPEFITVHDIPTLKPINTDHTIEIRKNDVVVEILPKNEQPSNLLKSDDIKKSDDSLPQSIQSSQIEESTPEIIQSENESQIIESEHDGQIISSMPELIDQSEPVVETPENENLEQSNINSSQSSLQKSSQDINISIEKSQKNNVQESVNEEEVVDNTLEDSIKFSEPEFITVHDIPTLKPINTDHTIEIRKNDVVVEILPKHEQPSNLLKSDDIKKSDDSLPQNIQTSQIEESTPDIIQSENESQIIKSEHDDQIISSMPELIDQSEPVVETPENENLEQSNINSSQSSLQKSSQDINISIEKSQKNNVQESVNEEEVVDNTLEDSIKFSEPEFITVHDIPSIKPIKTENEIEIRKNDVVVEIIKKPQDILNKSEDSIKSSTSSIKSSIDESQPEDLLTSSESVEKTEIEPNENIEIGLKNSQTQNIDVSQQEEQITSSLNDSLKFSEPTFNVNLEIPKIKDIKPPEELQIINKNIVVEILPPQSVKESNSDIHSSTPIDLSESKPEIQDVNPELQQSLGKSSVSEVVVPPQKIVNSILEESYPKTEENMDESELKVTDSVIDVSQSSIKDSQTENIIKSSNTDDQPEVKIDLSQTQKEVIHQSEHEEDKNIENSELHLSDSYVVPNIGSIPAIKTIEPVDDIKIIKKDIVVTVNPQTNIVKSDDHPELHPSKIDEIKLPESEESIDQSDLSNLSKSELKTIEPYINTSVIETPINLSESDSSIAKTEKKIVIDDIKESELEKTEKVNIVDVKIGETSNDVITKSTTELEESLPESDLILSDGEIIPHGDIPKIRDIKKTEDITIEKHDIVVEPVIKPSISNSSSQSEADIDLISTPKVIIKDSQAEILEDSNIHFSDPVINDVNKVPEIKDVHLDEPQIINKDYVVEPVISQSEKIPDLVSLHESSVKGSVENPTNSITNSSLEDSKSEIEKSKPSMMVLSKSELADSQHSNLHNSDPSLPDLIKESIKKPTVEEVKPIIPSEIDSSLSDSSKLSITKVNDSIKTSKPEGSIKFSSEADKSTIFDPNNFIFVPTPNIEMSHFSPSTSGTKKGHGRTNFALQSVNNRILPNVQAQTKASVTSQIFKSFPLLHKCVQSALTFCKPDFNKLKAACEKSNNRECEIKNFTASIKCSADEELINNACYKKCPEGFKDYKLFCLKPTYIKRSVRPFVGEALKENEQLYGDNLIVEKCQKYGRYMNDFGPDYCRAKCPLDFKDRGLFCQKPARFQKQKVHIFDRKTAIKTE